jgi:DNA-binding NtrC family response regulator
LDQTVLLLQDDRAILQLWKNKLGNAGFTLVEAASSAAVIAALKTKHLEAIVCGDSYEGRVPLALISQARDLCLEVAIIFVATEGSEDLAVQAFRAGATDYIHHSLDLEELIASLTRALAKSNTLHRPSIHTADVESTRISQVNKLLSCPIIGNSPAIREIQLRLLRIAASDSNILITGESGTGKDLAAQFVHRASLRAPKPLLSVNCAAIPESLLESELFGYEKGAFTGAQWSNAGLLERADGGTLFLDEIGEMSPIAQAKILRVIETRELTRLGGRKPLGVDVRFIAATNQNIESSVRDRKFREDLYFRLNVSRVALPPLRKRMEDLHELLTFYIRQFNQRTRRAVEGLSDTDYQQLFTYSWPGNIRELRNLLEAIFVNLPPEHVAWINLPPEFVRPLEGSIDSQSERDRVLSALLSTRWNKSKAAERLHWSRMTLYRKMAQYDISPNRTAADSLSV